MTRSHPLSPSHLARLFLLVGLLILGLAGTFSLAQAAPPPQDVANGQALFKTKCAACHTIGGGKLVGPDLQGVTTRRDASWLARWIKEPDKMLAEGDAIATQLLAENNNVAMPNLALSDAEVADLIAYFQSVDGTAASTPQPTAASALTFRRPPNTPITGCPFTRVRILPSGWRSITLF
ncbi:MAG: c-type cytochrome [Anaerolineae bacterium]